MIGLILEVIGLGGILGWDGMRPGGVILVLAGAAIISVAQIGVARELWNERNAARREAAALREQLKAAPRQPQTINHNYYFGAIPASAPPPEVEPRGEDE